LLNYITRARIKRLKVMQMDLSLQISATGETTVREVHEATLEVCDVLERFLGVARVEPQHSAAPVGAKNGLVEALGGLALSVAPAVLKAVLQTVQSVLSRQPAATKVLIQSGDPRIGFEFDPQRIRLEELVNAAERLRAAVSPA
jgi:hypothetical protein